MEHFLGAMREIARHFRLRSPYRDGVTEVILRKFWKRWVIELLRIADERS